jgi:hypothetical protein
MRCQIFLFGTLLYDEMPSGRFHITGQTLGGVADPENSDDAVTKSFHDTAMSGKADVSHSHPQSDITNLISDLAGKSDSSHTHAGLVTLARINADVQNSSGSSFTNLFTIPILANEVWSFDCVIYFLTAASTTGIVLQADSPNSPIASQVSLLTLETATTLRDLTGAQGVALIGTAGLSTVLEARISGTIENGSNAGNIVIKFRSEVNASAVTVKRGSFGRFYKH